MPRRPRSGTAITTEYPVRIRVAPYPFPGISRTRTVFGFGGTYWSEERPRRQPDGNARHPEEGRWKMIKVILADDHVVMRDGLRHIQKSAQLNDANERLEQRAAACTAQLSASNRDLRREVEERVRAERALQASRDELRGIAAISASAREAEQRRIARELHDELAQTLATLKNDLEWLIDPAPIKPAPPPSRAPTASTRPARRCRAVRGTRSARSSARTRCPSSCPRTASGSG